MRPTRRGIPFTGRVLITGGTGFLGHHVLPVLKDKWTYADFIDIQGKNFFDLTQKSHVSTLFNSVENNNGPIRTVIHLAALSGGIKDNSERQASYFYQNMMMGLNMLEECAKPARVVQNLIMFMGGCSMPNKEGKETPFTEDEVWDGLPVETSLGYSFAKKSLVVAAWAYKQQFGLKTMVLLPTNLIGEWDNFHPDQSHVVPALIKRFVEAREEGNNTVTVWGDPRVTRDFIYAGDVAKVMPDVIGNFDEVGPLNISSGVGTTIEELASIIKETTGFQGKIHFDKTKLTGQMYKVLDNTRLLKLLSDAGSEWEPTPLIEAIGKTVDWYLSRVHKK
jgi:GDP-L-fucose synthase